MPFRGQLAIFGGVTSSGQARVPGVLSIAGNFARSSCPRAPDRPSRFQERTKTAAMPSDPSSGPVGCVALRGRSSLVSFGCDGIDILEP